MDFKFNQIREQSTSLSAFDKIENLTIEGLELQEGISNLENQLGPQSPILHFIDDLRRDLQSLTSSYENLCLELHEKLSSERDIGAKLIKAHEERKEIEQMNTAVRRQRLLSKETLIQDKERELESSLRKIHDLWDGNIKEMEISVEHQRQTLQRMDFEHRSQLEEMELEIQQTLEEPLKHTKPGDIIITQITETKSSTSGHKNSSGIILDQLITESDQEPLEESLQSIESLQMLNTQTEPVEKAVKSNNLRLPDIKMGPMLNIQSVNNSYLTDSHASSVFDRLIDEAEEQGNKEKIPDGWNPDMESENESFSVENRSEEIRKALKILHKFNLLNPHKVLKLAEIMNSPDKSSNLELILQIMNIQSNKKKKQHPSLRITNPHLSSSGKPPTPTDKSNWKKQLSIQGSQEPPPQDLACTTPKSAFLFPEENEYNKTIISTDNPSSSRKKKKLRRFDCESEQDLHQLQA